MFGSEPFAGTITDRPTGMTSSGGLPWRPSRGCRTRVKLPGGSLPMMVRVSMPSSCRARCLQLRMLYDRTPEGPRVRDDDPDLHRGSKSYGARHA